jgi:hypothetical protein
MIIKPYFFFLRLLLQVFLNFLEKYISLCGDCRFLLTRNHDRTDADWTGLCDVFQVFEDWNKGELDSFLIEITKDILKFKDSDGKCAASTVWIQLHWKRVHILGVSVSWLLHVIGIKDSDTGKYENIGS